MFLKPHKLRKTDHHLLSFASRTISHELKLCSLEATPELSGKRLLKTTNEAVILGRVEVLQEFSCRYDPYAVLSSLVHLI